MHQYFYIMKLISESNVTTPLHLAVAQLGWTSENVYLFSMHQYFYIMNICFNEQETTKWYGYCETTSDMF